jgi:hypothetical protein
MVKAYQRGRKEERDKALRVRNTHLFYALRAQSWPEAERHIKNARKELG